MTCGRCWTQSVPWPRRGALAYLVVKEQVLGLDDRERARRDALRGDAQSWVDDLAASLGDAPDLARALFEYVRGVEARPEALEEAHRNGLATQVDVEAAYRERARMRTLVALYGLSAVLSGGAAARGLVKRLLRRPDGLSDDAAADDLAVLASRTRKLSPDGEWNRIPNPSIVWGKGNQPQGEAWKRHLAERGDLGDWIEERSPKFKTFDFFDRATRAATTAKTLNTGADTYSRRPRQIFSTLKSYIEKIAEFDGYDRKGYRIRQGEIEGRRMELAIQSRTTAEQMDEINRARAYAESLGIELEVTIIE